MSRVVDTSFLSLSRPSSNRLSMADINLFLHSPPAKSLELHLPDMTLLVFRLDQAPDGWTIMLISADATVQFW